MFLVSFFCGNQDVLIVNWIFLKDFEFAIFFWSSVTGIFGFCSKRWTISLFTLLLIRLKRGFMHFFDNGKCPLRSSHL